jgi:hypothetical protein
MRTDEQGGTIEERNSSSKEHFEAVISELMAGIVNLEATLVAP